MRKIVGLSVLVMLLAGCRAQPQLEEAAGGSIWMGELKLRHWEKDGELDYPILYEDRQTLEDAWGRANWRYCGGSLFRVGSSWDPPSTLAWGDSYSAKDNEYTTRNEATVDTKVVWFRNWDTWVCGETWFVEVVKSAIRTRLAAEGKPDPFK